MNAAAATIEIQHHYFTIYFNIKYRANIVPSMATYISKARTHTPTSLFIEWNKFI